MDLNHTAEKFINGKLLLINKPINWTSFQVVNKIRWTLTNFFGLKALKVGHCGTLDPLATGLMLICTGKMTKKINDYTSLDKSYSGKIRLGATTQSYDLETTPENFKNFNHITLNEIEKAKKKFLGTVFQKPPIYSAVKKNGKRLYQYARSGEKIEIESRKVNINSFEISDVKLPDLSFLISCSKGTYIRSLANDFGKVLKCGAHLVELHRCKIGSFSVENSITIEKFTEQFKLKKEL